MTNKVKQTLNYLRLYHFGMATLTFLAFCCVSIFLIPGFYDESTLGGTLVLGFFFAIFTLPFAIVYLILGLNVHRRGQVIFILNVVTLIFGLGSIISFVPAVLLLINLFDREVRVYFLDETEEAEVLPG